jgi:hypothetical protein
MAYDVRRDRVCLFGKVLVDNLNGYIYQRVADTWEWDATNGWVQRSAGGASDTWCHLVYDDHRAVLILLVVPSNQHTQVFEWDGSGSWAPMNMTISPGTVSGATFDSLRGRVVAVGYGFGAAYGATSPAQYTPHGPGCPASLGTTMSTDLTNMPSALAVLAMGFSDQSHGTVPLPFDLTPSGMPGCFVRVDPFATVAIAGISGTGTSQLTVPNQSQLLGVQFFQQALVLAPGANTAGLVMSNSMRAVVGRLR